MLYSQELGSREKSPEIVDSFRLKIGNLILEHFGTIHISTSWVMKR